MTNKYDIIDKLVLPIFFSEFTEFTYSELEACLTENSFLLETCLVWQPLALLTVSDLLDQVDTLADNIFDFINNLKD